MARIRYIKPDFFTDEDLAELSYETRIAFAGLWCHADKSGRLEDRPKYLKAMIFPYDKVDMEAELKKLALPKKDRFPFIQRYSVNGTNYIQIITWEKHQRPHNTEKESIIPPPEFPPIPPLMEKGMEKGMEKLTDASLTTNNVQINVKDTLKLQYGEFNNVFLSDKEFNKLNKIFGENTAKEKIENLSQAIASKGYKYKSHYATILSWERKNKTKDPKTW